jgi:hypothetical protein
MRPFVVETMDEGVDAHLLLERVVRRGASVLSVRRRDALELFFDSNRFGGYGGNDLWSTTRAATSDSWSGALPPRLKRQQRCRRDAPVSILGSDDAPLRDHAPRRGRFRGSVLHQPSQDHRPVVFIPRRRRS